MSDHIKLLIITQKVDINDDNLGFFHAWLEEFARKVERIIVICLEKGEYNLPDNVKILSLGKEEKNNFQFSIFNFQFFKKLKYILNFYRYIWKERQNYDAVFVHMNFEYVVLGGIFWRLFGKKIGLWYAHGYAPFSLRLAEKIADYIFTSSKKGYRLFSNKLIITGQGIDTEKFQNPNYKFQINSKIQITNYKFRIITAGRIALVKNYEVLIEAAEILKNKNFGFEIKIAGGPILKQDKIYFKELKNLIKQKGLEKKIIFKGPIPYKNIAEFYQSGDLFVNFSNTGSLDKAVLEAMASGLLILTSNEAFKEILEEKYLTSKDSAEIAQKIILLSGAEPDPFLKDYVVQNHSLEKLIKRIADYIQSGKTAFH